MTKILLSPSSLASVAGCTTKAWLSKRCGLTTREESAALKSGGDAHAAVAHYFRHEGDVEGAKRLFEELYKEWALANVLDDNIRAWRQCRDVMEAWFQANKIEQLPYMFDPAEVECHVEVPLVEVDEAEVWLEGYIDLPVIEKATSSRYVLDHKFTGWLDASSVQEWRLSAQFKAYAWMWEQARGEKVSGVLVDGVEWCKIPEVRLKKNEEEYQCRTHSVPYSECRLYHAKRQLVQITTTPEDTAIWLRNAQSLGRSFAGTWVAFDRASVDPLDAVQQMPLEGTFNGLCKWCEFKRFCAGGRQRYAIETMMVEREERHASK